MENIPPPSKYSSKKIYSFTIYNLLYTLDRFIVKNKVMRACTGAHTYTQTTKKVKCGKAHKKGDRKSVV